MVAVRLVDSDGELRSYNSIQHPQEIAMLKCCVGMCGVIYDITFLVRYTTRETVTPELILIQQISLSFYKFVYEIPEDMSGILDYGRL